MQRNYFAATPPVSGVTTPEELRDSIDQLLGTNGSTETHPQVGFTEIGAKPYRPHRANPESLQS